MPLNLTTFKKSLKKAFSQIESTQAEALSEELAKNYRAGRTAGTKHKSTRPLISAEDPEEDGLTTEEKEELAIILALFLGKLTKFNTMAQTQILNQVSTMVDEGKTMEEVKQYVSDVFHGKETVEVDNTGKKTKELYVDKDLQISERSKIISKPFFAGVLTYTAMLAETASHRAYEEGRKQALITQGQDRWVFVGPVDEVARPWHVSLVGQIYTWGTLQSDYAEKVLREPHCRHRAQEYSEKDYDAKYWQRLKDEAGLYWDDKEQRWGMKTYEVKKNKTPLTKVAPVKKVQKVEIKRTPEEVQKVIKDHEAKIKINDYETGTIFDKNGNILINLKGGESRVTFEDAKLFKGNILTHNHPQHLGGGSFSKQDIITACKTSVSEVRVVDMNTAYIMKLKNEGNFSEELLEKIQPAYDKHYSDIVSKLSDDVRSGKTTLEKAEAIAQNRIWTRVAYDIKEIDYKLDLLDV